MQSLSQAAGPVAHSATAARKRWYWISTGLFAVFMGISALGELTRATDVVTSLVALEIPLYYLTLLGTLKILGVIALLVPGYPRLTEWTYAGFFFGLLGALFALAVMRPAFISDYVAAPAALILWSISYGLFRQTQTTG